VDWRFTGAVPGGRRLWLPCQEKATKPPFGTFSDPAPVLAYVQRPDLPSDFHSDQYASGGGVFTHGSLAGLPETRQTNPGCRWTGVRGNPARGNTDEAGLLAPDGSQPRRMPPPSSPKSTTTFTPRPLQ